MKKISIAQIQGLKFKYEILLYLDQLIRFLLLFNQLRKQKDVAEGMNGQGIAMKRCEIWTIGEADRKKQNDFEMWGYRRMLKITINNRRLP